MTSMAKAAPLILTSRHNLVLIGYRASGKTVVGRELARRLGRPFVDLDQVLVAKAGESIAALVAREGWEEFRRREKALVAGYAAAPGQVLAPGGGVVLNPANVSNLRKNGILIYLQAPSRVLRERLIADKATAANRPSLTGDDPGQEIDEVMVVREPLYQQAAQLIIDTTDLSVPQLADLILGIIQNPDQEDPHGR